MTLYIRKTFQVPAQAINYVRLLHALKMEMLTSDGMSFYYDHAEQVFEVIEIWTNRLLSQQKENA